MPDIVLTNPPIANDPGNHPLPYGLWQLGSFVAHQGYEPQILDLNFTWRTTDATYDQLRALVCDVDSPIVGFTCMGNNLPTALELAQDLKTVRPDVTILFGGPHVSLVGPELLKRFSFIDGAIIGEGEWTLTELLSAMRRGRDSAVIPGLLRRGAPFLPRRLMPSLDALPYLDLRLLDWEPYFSSLTGGSQAFPILAGSGCPFSCSFCSTSIMWERRFRVKPPEWLVKEMEWLASETGQETFDLIHDIFTANRRYASAFCDAVRPSGLHWLCSSRIDGLCEEQIAQMSAAGCRGIFFGVESGSQRMQQIIGKRLKVDRILPTMATCLAYGIDCVCSTIFGFPQESWEDIEATVRMCLDARDIGVGRANLHLLMALPGTQVYREAMLAETVEERDLRRAGLPIMTPQAHGWIHTDPKLFSAFYWVQHEFITKDDLFSLARWDAYLASHPRTLRSLLGECPGRLPAVMHAFRRRVPADWDGRNGALLPLFHKSAAQISRGIYHEEDRLLMLLAHYQASCQQGAPTTRCWMGYDPDGRHVLYEIDNAGVSIHVYLLEDDVDLLDWERLPSEQWLHSIPSDGRIGPCWPVRRKARKEEVI